ncbi:DNA-binding MurR/RpiR family transcriptional regulator [Olsenella profusa DSM 13989]|uniref:MurR/RpiR family transcriptional regulator n=1 Tax=Olsenella profusa TaxID=138595 RepID=UPI002785F2D1|nr:MurR/RpiR family transcriptional regulator [Olsenella profusa]MDP9858342.1 DNA-binding MurR/RpiR family transcriptional regulator [Olsenella profusa DSM 13989]
MITDEIKRKYSHLHGAEKRVADYVLAHPSEVTLMSMADLSSKTGTSDATVMRMCKSIGQSGFYQLKISIAMDLNAIDSSNSEAARDDVGDVVTFVNEIGDAISGMSRYITQDDIDECVAIIKKARRVYTFGWGNTNVIAADFAHRLLRFGKHSFNSDNLEFMMRSIILADPGDAFVAVSHSGNSIYTNDCMRLAKENGLRSILITGSLHSEATELADLTIATGAADSARDLGRQSHVSELVVIDTILHFLGDNMSEYQAGTKSEAYLTQFKR